MKKRISILLISAAVLVAPVIKVNGEENKEVIHIVKQGETVWSIAEQHKDKYEKTENMVAKIQIENNVTEVVYPGQKIIIRK